MFTNYKRFFSISVFALLAFSLTGCKEDSASEKLAKIQLDSIAEIEKKKEEGIDAIMNNTLNPFSFDKKEPAEK